MAWVSPKVIKILDSLGEKSLIEKIPSMSQEDAEKAVDEAFGKSGKENIKTTNGDRKFGKKTDKNTFIDDETGEESPLNDNGELVDEEFDADRDEDTDIDSELYEQKEMERRLNNPGTNEFEERYPEEDSDFRKDYKNQAKMSEEEFKSQFDEYSKGKTGYDYYSSGKNKGYVLSDEEGTAIGFYDLNNGTFYYEDSAREKMKPQSADNESSPMNEFSGPDREGPSYAQLEANKQDQYRASDSEWLVDENGKEYKVDKAGKRTYKQSAEDKPQSAEDKWNAYKEKGKPTWNQKLTKGDRVFIDDRDGNEIEGFINGFYKGGELQDEDTYEEGKDNMWHDFRGLNLVDKDGKEIGNINANQIKKHEKPEGSVGNLINSARKQFPNDSPEQLAKALENTLFFNKQFDIEFPEEKMKIYNDTIQKLKSMKSWDK